MEKQQCTPTAKGEKETRERLSSITRMTLEMARRKKTDLKKKTAS